MINKIKESNQIGSTTYVYIKIKKIPINTLINTKLSISLISKDLTEKIELKISSNNKVKV